MFDISWTEFLLIGVVALIVIGPKELPAVMRTMGQWTRKLRGMAADFQNQFQEAMREAEIADLKKEVDDVAHDIKHYDPLKEVRASVEATEKDIRGSLEQKPVAPTLADVAAPAAAAEASVRSAMAAAAAEMRGTDIVGVANDPVMPDADAKPGAEFPLPPARDDSGEKDVVAAATGPAAPESAEQAGKGRSG